MAACFRERDLAVVNGPRRLCKRRTNPSETILLPHCHQTQLIPPARSPIISPCPGALQAGSASSRTSAVLPQDLANRPVSLPPLTPTDSRGLWLLTIVLPLDKGLPLTEPLHADTVDDAWRFLCLESLVQLGEQRTETCRKDLVTPGVWGSPFQ